MPHDDYDSIPLGAVPDGEIAARLGVTRRAVQAARRRRKLPAARVGAARDLRGRWAAISAMVAELIEELDAR